MFSSTVIRATLSSALTATKLSPTQTLLASSTTASLHTSSGPRQSRIKWGHTHKPFYHVKKTNKAIDEPLTAANRAFVQEATKDAYVPDFDDGRYAYKRLEEDSEVTSGPVASSLLKGNLKPWPRGSYGDLANVTRSGVLARKIGVHPMWKSNGTQVMVTLLHVDDNHVIRYIPPEDFAKTTVHDRRLRPTVVTRGKSVAWPSVVVGALAGDPQKFTKDYCGLFTDCGVMPKKLMARFPVSENAVIQPGTPIYASHFQPGQYIDVKGKSSRRGYQGVMKRWGFKGGRHDIRGATKSHRRPGCIGSGRDKSRVWPGQKMPGHMGGKINKQVGLQIVRINYKYNVLYVKGHNIPGEPGEMIKVFDTKVTGKQWKCRKATPRHFPTCYPESHDQLPEEEYAEGYHDFNQPTITYKK